jgi:hypothetical protein
MITSRVMHDAGGGDDLSGSGVKVISVMIWHSGYRRNALAG